MEENENKNEENLTFYTGDEEITEDTNIDISDHI